MCSGALKGDYENEPLNFSSRSYYNLKEPILQGGTPLFTGEEMDFIMKDQGFYQFLKTMTRPELSAFREIVTYICDLSSEEREMFFARIDEALAEMGEPAVRPLSEITNKKIIWRERQ